jgi:hypothetical protein
MMMRTIDPTEHDMTSLRDTFIVLGIEAGNAVEDIAADLEITPEAVTLRYAMLVAPDHKWEIRQAGWVVCGGCHKVYTPRGGDYGPCG